MVPCWISPLPAIGFGTGNPISTSPFAESSITVQFSESVWSLFAAYKDISGFPFATASPVIKKGMVFPVP